MLLVLTVCHLRAVSAAAWDEWTRKQITALYHGAEAWLDGGDDALGEWMDQRAEKTRKEAEADLDEMEFWLTENWGPLAAANIIEAVLERIAALAEMPLAGAPRPEFGDAVRFVTSGRYVIYYEVVGEQLTILRILHSARNREAIMRPQSEEGEKP